MSATIIGLDIGGANLKLATPAGWAMQYPFALWKQPDRLAEALRGLLAAAPKAERLAVTMTGELCDCFMTKREGVGSILDAVVEAAPGVELVVWTTAGRFVTPVEARRNWLQTAAANWLAAATIAGRAAPLGPALFIDIGSTTADLVALRHGRPMPLGRTDPERLASKELVYTGVRRTPVCSLLGLAGAAELFATMHDVYLVLGRLPEEPENRETADGRPATVPCAQARLCRMLGADLTMLSSERIRALAADLASKQRQALQQAAQVVASRLPEPPRCVVVAGAGEFLAAEIQPDLPVTRLSLELGVPGSTALCAYAVSVLASELRGSP